MFPTHLWKTTLIFYVNQLQVTCIIFSVFTTLSCNTKASVTSDSTVIKMMTGYSILFNG